MGGFCFLVTIAPRVQAAGVTIITHGFGGDASGWVLYMGGGMPGYPRFPGTNVVCYEMSITDNNIVASRKIAGGHPTNDFSAEIVIKLDWGDLAGFFNQHDTYEVAQGVVPRLLQAGFIPELGNRALAELPLHLIGHSRGGSLVCEMSYLLGTNGVWVDQVTTLDPHPVNQDGNSDPLIVVDAPLRVYDNVLFADNYYQEFGGYPHGQFMPSSYNREFISLPGGYSSAHSDTHLWYHGTIQLGDPAFDGEASLTASNRAVWFTSYEVNGARAGFYYGRLGRGNRLSFDQPAGPGTDRLVDGYNQRWFLGTGGVNNRTALATNNGNWPNVIRMNLVGTNLMAQGQSNEVSIYYQWARAAMSSASMNIYLDDDFNPYNGNEQLVRQVNVPDTTRNDIGVNDLIINVAATNTTPGVRSIYARIMANGRTRYLYAPELLTVFSSFQPPSLSISREALQQVAVQVNGVAGQRVVLERTADFRAWQPLATNWLASNVWRYAEASGEAQRFYRAVLR